MSAEMSVSHARAHWSDALRAVTTQPLYLTSHGQRRVVMVDAAVYDRMVEEWEDYQDLLAYDEAKTVDDGTRIPWEEVKRELGLLDALRTE